MLEQKIRSILEEYTWTKVQLTKEEEIVRKVGIISAYAALLVLFEEESND